MSKSSKSDIKKVKEEYLNIIQILKEKIADTEELIRIKQLVKSEFAYKLSKNMLKTISNLSMEVMNLNQVSLKGGFFYYKYFYVVYKQIIKSIQLIL